MTKQDIIRAIRAMRETATDEVALESVELYPIWKAGIEVTAESRYQYDGTLYRCVQAHTTQEDWTPDLTPALWTVVSLEEWPEWSQPISAVDAYDIGAKVSHNGKHWISTAAANVWEPGVYGWEEA